MVGHDWFDLFDDNPYVRADYFARMDQGTSGRTSTARSGRAPASGATSLEQHGQHDESGAVTGIATIGEDVTERHRADAVLRSREELFRSLIENASDVITILAADGTSLYESPSVVRVLGWPPDEIVGRPELRALAQGRPRARQADVR